MSDRIAVMSQGKVLQMGPAVEIYERPTTRFVAEFIGEANFLDGRVKSLKGKDAVVTIPAWGADLAGLCTAKVQVGDEVAVSIRPEKVRLTDAPEGTKNCLEGVVTTSTYIGSDTHVYLDVRGQRMKVWEQNRTSVLDRRGLYRAGTKAWITLPAENTLILSRA
jgi:ABC-type Fe3+/spermidine/putrescine transport system ATPase subunit